jgi:peptide/nickel transport system substrate-binding protein
MLTQGDIGVPAITPRNGLPGMHLLYLPLFALDEDGDHVGRLVERWEHSEDYTEWTYHLRRDVRWHDGAPFTARDVEFTYALFQHPDVLRFAPGACEVSIVDDSTFTMMAHDGCDPQNWWNVILPSHLLEHLEGRDVWNADLWDDPIGNGPYRFLHYTPGTAIELEANPDFYAGRPRIDRLIVRLMPGGGNPWLELEAGNVDFAPVNGPALERLARDPRFVVYWGRPEIGWVLAWNHRHPFLGDPALRKALTLAIEKEELGRLYQYPPEAPIVDLPYLRDGRDPPEPTPSDPGAGAEELERLGWTDGDGDGVRERDGTPLQFELLVSAMIERAGVLIQAQLATVGARVELQALDRGLIRGRVDEGDFEAALPGGIKGSAFLELLAGTEPDWESAIGYRNPELPGLVTILETSLNPAEREHAMRELQEIFRRDQPVSLVVPNAGNASFVAHRRVKGLRSPLLWFPSQIMDRLWIEEEPADAVEDN